MNNDNHSNILDNLMDWELEYEVTKYVCRKNLTAFLCNQSLNKNPTREQKFNGWGGSWADINCIVLVMHAFPLTSKYCTLGCAPQFILLHIVMTTQFYQVTHDFFVDVNTQLSGLKRTNTGVLEICKLIGAAYM